MQNHFTFTKPPQLDKKSCNHDCEPSSSQHCCNCSNPPQNKSKCRYCQFKTFESFDGKTRLAFHGTSLQSAKSILREGFLPSVSGMYGSGVYVAPHPSKAAQFKKGGDGVILVCLVKPGKIKKTTSQGEGSQHNWQQEGYHSGHESWNDLQALCVFNPGRVFAWTIVKD